MVAVVFETPGLIDIQSFTTFGVNAKPNTDSPIGYFGTGLKYAMAVLVREKIPVTVYIGHTAYVFYSKPTTFRNKEFDLVKMKKRQGILSKWQYQDLPFTTEHGKNWGLWQAFRELESNTRDEKGQTYTVNNPEIAVGHGNTTFIVVDSRDFVDVYHNRDEIFLPEGLTSKVDSDDIQVFDKPSKYIYFRGLRVVDLPDKNHSMYTYNILRHIDLTEDRTAKYSYQYEWAIAEHAVKSTNTDYVRKFATASKDTFEGSIDLDYTSEVPSEEFKNVVGELRRLRNPALRSSVSGYYGKHSYKEIKAPNLSDEEWVKAIHMSIDAGDRDTILDLIFENKSRAKRLVNVPALAEVEVPF